MENYNYDEFADAAMKVVNAVFDEKTNDETQQIFALSKEIYEIGVDAGQQVAAKMKAVVKVAVAMFERIWNDSDEEEETARGFGDEFSQIVSRGVAELE